MGASPDCMVVLPGEWDLARRDELTALVEARLCDCEPGAAIVVDLRPTTFIDSSALGVLVGLYNRLRGGDRRLITLCPTEGAVRRTIDLLELGDRLCVLD
ncbi:MAG TPA: STAS domain-containing protein, partial [Solirubrobacteraceae bacterium]